MTHKVESTLSQTLTFLEKKIEEYSIYKEMPLQDLAINYSKYALSGSIEKISSIIERHFTLIDGWKSRPLKKGLKAKVRLLSQRSTATVNKYEKHLAEFIKNGKAASDILLILLEMDKISPTSEKQLSLLERVESLPPSKELFRKVGLERKFLTLYLQEKALVVTRDALEDFSKRANQILNSKSLSDEEIPTPPQEEISSSSPSTHSAEEVVASPLPLSDEETPTPPQEEISSSSPSTHSAEEVIASPLPLSNEEIPTPPQKEISSASLSPLSDEEIPTPPQEEISSASLSPLSDEEIPTPPQEEISSSSSYTFSAQEVVLPFLELTPSVSPLSRSGEEIPLPPHEELPSVSLATLSAVEVDLPPYEEEDPLRQRLDELRQIPNPLERFESLHQFFEGIASGESFLFSIANAEIKVAIEEAICEQQELESTAAKKIAMLQLVALSETLKSQAGMQFLKSKGKENAPSAAAITDALFGILPPGINQYLQNKVIERKKNPTHFDSVTLTVLPFSMWPGSTDEKMQWLEETRSSLNALNAVRAGPRASDEMQLRYNLLQKSNPAPSLKAQINDLIFLSVVLNLGKEGLADSSLRLAHLRNQKCYFAISNKKLSIGERLFYHLFHIQKNAQEVQKPWTDPDFASEVFASPSTTPEERVRSAQRTLIELQLHALDCALRHAHLPVQQSLLKTMESLSLSPDDLPEGVDNVARRLFTILHTLFRELSPREKGGFNPDDRQYKGEFGRIAFQGNGPGRNVKWTKLQAIEQLRKELKVAWKIGD